jgi:hypothetical protein
MIVGSTIIETPSPMRARYFELYDGMRELFMGYMLRGATWLSAPKPRLADDLYRLDAAGLPLLGESEPVFDAANILRIGRDLIYQVSRSGNEMGLRWLESTLRLMGDFRIHPLRRRRPARTDRGSGDEGHHSAAASPASLASSRRRIPLRDTRHRPGRAARRLRRWLTYWSIGLMPVNRHILDAARKLCPGIC